MLERLLHACVRVCMSDFVCLTERILRVCICVCERVKESNSADA